MKRSLRYLAMESVRNLAILCVWAMLFLPGWVMANDLSHLEVDLYLKKVEGAPVLKYTLGVDPIPVWVVLSNSAAWPLNLDPSVLEDSIDQHLVLIDPAGNKHRVALESEADDMPQPVRYAGRDLVPVTVMAPGTSKTLEIDDVRAIFPMMSTHAGIYQLKLSMPVTIYGWTLPGPGQEPMGVLDDQANVYQLETKTIQIYVFPVTGARLAVRVEDLAMPEERYREFLPVKVFRTSDIGEEDLSVVWDKAESLLSGQTKKSGWADWPPEASCVSQPPVGESYTAVAKYQGDFEKVVIDRENEDWQMECQGQINKYIFFNPPEESFSVFGINSVWLRNQVRIMTGDVGAGDECDVCLIAGYDVAADGGVWMADHSAIKAHRVYLDSTASVWDVSCDTVESETVVRNEVVTLDGPVWETLPYFPDDGDFSPSTDDQIINSDATLGPKSYGDLIIGSQTTVTLDGAEGATYDFNNISLGSHAALLCTGPTEIRVAGTIESGGAKAAYIGPQNISGVTAKDVIIYVNGNGPNAVSFGQGHNIKANIYAQKGGLSTGEGCTLTGAFIAKDITIGQKSVVTLDSYFTDKITLSAQKIKVGPYWTVVLHWYGISESVYIYKYINDDLLTTYGPEGGGSFTDESFGKKPIPGTYVYKVCDSGDSTKCSNSARVEF